MRIACLQHVPFEDPAGILDWCATHHHPVKISRLFDGEPLPKLDDYDLLIVMGGPMSVHDVDQYAWLKIEKAHIRSAIDSGKQVLGICLGAQIIAEVLGGQVLPNEFKEIGWFEVAQSINTAADRWFASLPERFTAFHWHGERFTLPPRCTHLARSAACEVQAFSHLDRVLALQFHLESTPQSVQKLIDHCTADLVDGPFVQSPDQMLDQPHHFHAIASMIDHIMNRFALA